MHSISSRPPLSSSFNQSSCLFHDTCEPKLIRTSSTLSRKLCSCCCCCNAANVSICDRLTAVNPRFLRKRLTQLTLIQSSRLIFYGRIRQYNGNTFRFLGFDDLRDSYCYKKLRAFEQKQQFLSNMNDDFVNDGEVMLNLLTDEVGLEYNDIKNRKKINKEKKRKNLDLGKEDSFGELEGNIDFKVSSDNYYVAQTSSIACKNDLGKDCKCCSDEFVCKIEKQQESVQEFDRLSEKDTVNELYGDTDGVSKKWRKKSEKMLVKELSQRESNSSVNIESCKQHSQEIFETKDESGSRMKYKRSDKDEAVIKSTFTTENKSKVILEPSNIEMEKQKQYLVISSSEAMVTKPTSIKDNKDDGSVTCGQRDSGSSHSSDGSGPKGPSDEMWLVTDASTQESFEPDNTLGSSENGQPVKTNGRSLWTIIGDAVRLHWKPSRSGSHTPTSGGATANGSSYLSFSSHEPDDSNDENVRKRIINGLNSSRNTSLPMIKESSCCLKRSPEIKKMVKTDQDNLTELKRRKLVHKDQIFKQNLDEWEEIYNLENKQLKEDEMFMKEALLEAKKAADVYEVPVGAVIVKNGKIIARGYNMVEKLQDSTAHAEMICIRKASNIASSWRLSDTTLYVTLEPCPMCAGAILQARIHTVVWGAPNKLLGADGSWIRLFCDGDGGSSTMPPAPVHPFHPNMTVRRGVLAAECGEVMKHFFRLRRKKKTEPEPSSSISVSHHYHCYHHSNFLSKIHHALKVIFCL